MELLQSTSPFRREYAAARTASQQATVIQDHFLVRTVDSPSDLEAGSLYFFHGEESTYLVILTNADAGEETLSLRLALSGQLLKPIPRERFLESGRRRQLLRLSPRQAGNEPAADMAELPTAAPTADPIRPMPKGAVVLDMGAFSQLHDAAIRTGIVPNADLITHVRDREFRRGEYQQAFQVIEGLFGKFSAAAMHRDQRLRREDVDIASGRIQMSPKALLEKRARNTAETQCIERARGRFRRVLEGLRVLMQQPDLS